jgi:hypothetical protein
MADDKTKKQNTQRKFDNVDPLEKARLAKDYGYALNIIYGIPELTAMFKLAVERQWTAADFQAKLQGSKWYKDNNEYARAYLTAKAAGGADYATMQETARYKVQSIAAQMGKRLSGAELNSMADRYMSEGWGDPNRAAVMQAAIAATITLPPDGILQGNAGDLQQQLKAIAEANGLKYNDSYYLSASKSVASGLSTAEDWQREIRSQAASMYPAWSDKINSGMDINDLASGYINKMAQTLEIDPNSINLNDPYIRQALGAKDDKNNPTMMSMWEFEQQLRKDPRFMQTKQAQDDMFSAGNAILKMFGMAG